MISTRGPDNIVVLDRLAIPIFDICSSVIYLDTVTEILEKFPITRYEFKESLQFFYDNCGPDEHDFIELECVRDGEHMDVDTAGLSDWVYVSAVLAGYLNTPETDIILTLYSNGLKSFMKDALVSIIEGAPFNTEMSRMILEAFEESYGDVTAVDASALLQTLEAEDD